MVNITTPLLIIGAALPRTATTSIASALEQLGYKVFHATTWTPAFSPIWEDIVQADATNNKEQYRASLDRFVQLLSDEGFNATLDQPSCFVYQQLMGYYPNAKILQTQRDPGSWARSMVEMVYSMDPYCWQPPYNYQWNVTKGPSGYWAKQQLGLRDEEIHPRGVPVNSNPYNYLERKASVSLASCKVAYHRYHSRVKQVVPKDKLVTFHPHDGWQPLCDHFLPANNNNITCPSDTKFPHLNTKDDSFLLYWRRHASTKVHLYKLHPFLAKQEWLVNTVVFGMRQQRAVLATLKKWIPIKRKREKKRPKGSRRPKRDASRY